MAGLLRNEPVRPRESHGSLPRWQGAADRPRLGLVPATKNTGPETDRGEATRYLAELPWVPFAMTANRELSWRELDDGEVEVSTLVGGIAASVRLAFGESGLIKRASAMRPRVAGSAFVDTRWVGEFGDYIELGGIHVPGTAEVRWELPDGPFNYWRGEVASLARGIGVERLPLGEH